MLIEYVAYHGTVPSRVESILASGLWPSVNPDDWLGKGAYFFIDGLRDPKESAIDWVACSVWDNKTRTFREDKVAVIKAIIRVPADKNFDLREAAKIRAFHQFRREWIKGRHGGELRVSGRPEVRTYDAELFDAIKLSQGECVIVSNFHIQLSVRERFLRLDSRIPNVVVLCMITDPDSSIGFEITGVEMFDLPEWTCEGNG
ncbi:hypothetical protein ACF08B_06310 [Streptomyces sp. NPDC015139]|uniref:hypothetical protein n=1 Tax=Streptomyces sp. NPDC015139 TaxID=3364942 RepID=UPI003700C7CB